MSSSFFHFLKRLGLDDFFCFQNELWDLLFFHRRNIFLVFLACNYREDFCLVFSLSFFSQGGRIGEGDFYWRCNGLEIGSLEEKECRKKIDEAWFNLPVDGLQYQAPLLPWWAWLLIGMAAFTLTLGLCW